MKVLHMHLHLHLRLDADNPRVALVDVPAAALPLRLLPSPWPCLLHPPVQPQARLLARPRPRVGARLRAYLHELQHMVQEVGVARRLLHLHPHLRQLLVQRPVEA